MGCGMIKTHDPTFINFDILLASDEQTDRQTDRQTPRRIANMRPAWLS